MDQRGRKFASHAGRPIVRQPLITWALPPPPIGANLILHTTVTGVYLSV